MTSILQTSYQDKNLCLTLNRPQQKNALSYELLQSLSDEIQRPRPPDCRAIILDAKGNCFSAGADLTELKGTLEDMEMDKAIEVLGSAIRQSPVPVVAHVEGACIGGAVDLLLSCHYRIASSEAWFRIPAIQLGLLYNPEAVNRMSQQLSEEVLERLLLQAQVFDANSALRAGILTHIIGPLKQETHKTNNKELPEHKLTDAYEATRELLQALYHDKYDSTRWQQRREILLSSHERHCAVKVARNHTS